MGISDCESFGTKFEISGRFRRTQEARRDKPCRPCRGTVVFVSEDFEFRRARRDGGLRACRGEASQRAAHRDKASRACRGEVLKCSFWLVLVPVCGTLSLECSGSSRELFWDFMRVYNTV